MAFLRIEKGPQAGEIFEIPPDGARIGRDRDNEIHLMDETASRHHSRVAGEGSSWTIEDLGSANGTLVNGQPVETVALASGDRIRIGATTLSFEDGERFERDTVVIGPSTGRMSVVRSMSGREADPLSDPGRLSRVVAAGRGLVGALDVESLVGQLWDVLAREVRPDRGFFELVDRDGRTVHQASFPRSVAGGRKVALSSSVRKEVLERGEAVLIEAEAEDGFADRRSLAEAGVSSALGVPIAAEGRLVGLVYLDRVGPEGPPLDEDDLRFVAALLLELAPRLAVAARSRRQDEEIRRLRGQLEGAGPVLGASPAFEKVLALVGKVAPTDSSVLLVGETGSGKEVVARAIHAGSNRERRPFVAVNCAAIPEDLLESEFFGHEKGAFTGAQAAKKGKFLLADGGTLFLDEIGEIPVHLQSKLLRALEEQRFYAVGSDKETAVDVRLLAATNRDLAGALEDGSFRKDLYYRLSVVTIQLPPLRERAGDIRILVEAFLERLGRSTGRPPKSVTDEAWRVLEGYAWPGNVRELKNVVERALILSEGTAIGPEDLPGALSAGPGESSLETKRILTLKEAEEMAIRRALEFSGWKKGETVALLGTSWPTLNKKIKEYGITPPNE